LGATPIKVWGRRWRNALTGDLGRDLPPAPQVCDISVPLAKIKSWSTW
jgi:hypothetical protein